MEQTVKAKKLIYTLLLLAIAACALFLFACSSEQDGGSSISGVKIDDDIISWNAYGGAAKYSVVVDEKEYITEEPQFDLFYIAGEERTYKVKVCALSASDNPLTDYTENIDYVVTKRYLSGIGGILEENGEYTVGAANKKYINGKIIVPAYSNGKPITAIGENAFSGCDKLEKIYIPDTVSEISSNAFSGCTALRAVRLPNELLTIGSHAFSGCDILQKIYIPDTVTEIAEGTFNSCDMLKKIHLPNELSVIGKNAFAYCISLTSMDIPSGVTQIKGNPFFGCTGLTELTVAKGNLCYRANGTCLLDINTTAVLFGRDTKDIPTYAHRIENSAFNSCDSLIDAIIPDNIVEIGNSAFADCVNLRKVVLPKDLKVLEANIFSGCSSLVEVDLPNGLDQISICAFEKCTSLTAIVIPERVTRIKKDAFNGCSALENVKILSKLASFNTGIFYNCSALKRLEVAASKELCSTQFPLNFNGCDSLMELVVTDEDENVKSDNNCIIDKKNNRLIRGCKSSVIPDYIAEIGSRAFSGCSGLERVVIPCGVTKIGDMAFAKCNDLVYFVMPDSVTELGYGVFQDSLKLGGISLSQNISVIKYSSDIYIAGPADFFSQSGESTTLYVPYIYETKTEVRDDGKKITYTARIPSLPGWQFDNGQCNEFRGCDIRSDGGYSYLYSYTYKSTGHPYNGDTYATGPLPPMLDNREDETEEFFDAFYAKYDAEMNPRAPMRLGYEFKGWATEEGGEPVYKAYLNKNGTVCALSYAERKTIPNGTKLYAVWEKTK